MKVSTLPLVGHLMAIGDEHGPIPMSAALGRGFAVLYPRGENAVTRTATLLTDAGVTVTGTDEENGTVTIKTHGGLS